MFNNNTKYNKLYLNGTLYQKGFRNGQQILGDGSTPPVDPSLLLDIPFDTDFQNKVSGGVQMVVAGNAPTFANGAAIFNGSQSIKTAAPLNIGTNKVSMCFWIKTTSTFTSFMVELSEDYELNNGFTGFINGNSVNNVLVSDKNQGYNFGFHNAIINDDVWHFIVLQIDRSLPNDQNKIYVDGIQNYNPILNNPNSGNWSPNILYVGQRNANQFGYDGSIKNLKIYNRILTQSEIQNLML